MTKNRRIQLEPSKIRVGYNSHGAWSTLEEIRCQEVERGNYLPKLDYPPDTLAMWFCLTPRKALRYVALAEKWDHLSDETQLLTSEEEEMLECVTKIPLKPTDIIVRDDGDEGYLVLRPNKADQNKLEKSRLEATLRCSKKQPLARADPARKTDLRC